MSEFRLTGVHKSFGGVRALRRVDFEVRPGEVHALLGENGAGKSTLIKIMAGVHKPDSGRLFFGGSRSRSRARGTLSGSASTPSIRS